MDAERASKLDREYLKEKGGTEAVLVFRPEESDDCAVWEMESFSNALGKYYENGKEILDVEIELGPEDNATIFFTSGT